MTAGARSDRPDTRRSADTSDRDEFAALRRSLRRHDTIWYYGCRLRSLGVSVLRSTKYLDPSLLGPIVLAEMQHPSRRR
jgi:hypothetical protein